jgi:hypothetical protein
MRKFLIFLKMQYIFSGFAYKCVVGSYDLVFDLQTPAGYSGKKILDTHRIDMDIFTSGAANGFSAVKASCPGILSGIIFSKKGNVHQFVRLAAVISLLLLFSGGAEAQNTINISTSTNWSAISPQPTANDDVVINADGVTLTVNVANAVCKSITIGTGANNITASLTFNAASQLTVSGQVTMISGNKNSSVNMTQGGTLICEGFTSTGSGNSLVPGAGTVQFTAANTLPAIITSFNNLIIQANTTTLGANITVGNILTIQSGTTLANSTFTLTASGNTTINGTISGTGNVSFSGAQTISGTGTIASGTTSLNATTTIDAGASLTVTGTVSIPANATATNNGSISIGTLTGTNATSSVWVNAANATLNVSGALLGTGTLTATASGNTVNYNGAAQNIKAATYNNLTLSGSSSKTFAAGTTVNGTLSIEGTVSASAGTSPTFGSSAILRYATTASLTTGTALPATFSGAQVVVNMSPGTTVTLNENKTLSAANLVINSGILDLSTFTINRGTAGGSLSLANGATLRIGGTNSFPSNYSAHSLGATGTVDYAGTNQTVGTLNSSQSYGHLTLSGSGTKTLQTGTTSVSGNFTLAGTASATGVAGLTIGGNLSIGATAAFSAGTFTHNVAGNWSKSGTFNANTSTIVFNGTGATQTISGTNVFNNLTINRASGGTVTASGSTLTVTVDLNVAAGTFAGASTYGNVTIDSGATLESETDGTINVTGNWTNNGTFLANSGTVIFTGASAQSIGGTASTSFHNLTMNGTGLKTLTVTAPATISVNNILTLTSGILDIAAHTLTAGSASGGSSASYVRTSSTGRLKQYVNYQATRNFPIGQSSYNPVSITNNTQGGGDNFYFGLSDAAITNANDNTKTLNRKWILAKDNPGSVNVSLAFTFNSDDARGTAFDAGTTPRLGFYNGTFWAYTTATSTGTTTYSATGEILNFNHTDAFIGIGKDDAFSASKFGVTVFPQNPTLGAGGSIITVRSLNSQDVPTHLQTSTGFTVTASNTTFTASSSSGTIGVNSYEGTINEVTFTQATTDTKATLTAARTSGEDLTAGTSAPFDVIAGRIFEPKTTGLWSSPSNWRYSLDGGTTWRDTTAYPSALDVTDLIRIPASITLTADVTAYYYSFLIETGGTLILPSEGNLTLLHPAGNISGYDMHVHGTFKNTGGTFLNKDYGDTTDPDPEVSTYPNAIPGSTYPIEIHGGTYWHARDGGSVPIAEWYSLGGVKSTCIIEGSNVGGLNQEFENFTLTSGTNTLTGNMTVSGILTLTAGKITTGNYRVITTVTGTIAGNPGGWINGYLKRTAPVGTDISFLFPVGDETYYAPVTLFAGTVSQSGSMEVSTSRPGVAPPVASGLSSTKYINRKWNTANQGIVYSDATATWTFNDADEVESPGTVSLRRLSAGTWFVTGGTTDAAASNTISVTGLAYLGETASSEMYIGESTCDVASVWFGSVSTDWNDFRNWCSGAVPVSTTSVLIPGGIVRYPVISAAAAANHIEIMEGGSLSVTGSNTLSVYGNLTNNGTFTANTSTVDFLGETSNTVSGNLTFHNLTISKTGANGITAGSNITVNGTLYAQSANPSATKGTLDMGTYTVFMGPGATNTGDGDVTGTTTRNHAFALNTLYTYGHKHTGSRYLVAVSLPTSVSLRVSIGTGQPGWTGTPTGFDYPLLRKYEPAQTGGANMRVYTRFFYKQTEIPEKTPPVDESTLAVWVKYPGPFYEDRGWYDYDSDQNWISISDENFTTIPASLGEVQIAIAPTSLTVNTWLGGTSSDWNTADNWSLNHIPTSTEGVIIPNSANTSHDPILPSSPTAEAKFLIIQPGGIVDGGSGTITIYNDQVANAWSAEPAIGALDAGKFNPGGSTVIFNSQNTFADLSGENDFYNLTLPAGAKLRLGDNAYTGILGSLTLQGTLDAASTHNYVEFKANGDQTIPNPNYTEFPGYHNLKISGTGAKTLPATLNMTCDFTNNGTVDALSNSSTVIFNSGIHSKAINIGGTTATTFNNLTLNNAMGVNATHNITVNGVLNLQAANPSSIRGNLDIASGKVLTLGASTATVTGTGDITGTVTRSHVFLNGTFYYTTSANQWMVFTGLPDQVSNPLTISINNQIGTAPAWSGCSGTAITTPVNRIYTVWVSGNWGAARVNLRLRYLEGEKLSDELIKPYTLSVFRKTGISPSCTITELGKSNQDLANRNLGVALLQMSEFTTTEGQMEFAIAPSASTYLTWTGGAGTRAALAAGNWSPANVPSSSNRLYIPVSNSLPMDGGVYRTPVLSDSQTLDAVSIELQDGGELTAQGTTTINLSGQGAVFVVGTAATFTPGSGTVNITTAGENTLVGNITFHNLTIATGVSIFATANQNLNIGGTLTNNGTIQAQAVNNTFTFSGASQTIPNTSSGVANYRNLVISGSGTTLPATLNLNGNFTYSGSGLDATNNSCTLTMMGTTAQTISGSASATFHNLTINNPAGVALGNSHTVNGALTLFSGLVTTGTHTLTVGASGSISGASTGRYVNGKLARVYTDMGEKTFPIGKGGNYRPVTLEYTQLTGTSTVTAEQIESTIPGTPPAGASLFTSRHWVVTESGGSGFQYTITLDGTDYYALISGESRRY